MAQGTCSLPDCGRPHHAHGWCERHYKRWQKRGDVQADVPVQSHGQDPAQRFWAKISRRGPMLSPYLGPCWLYTGGVNGEGYGSFWDGNRARGAHCVGYELVKGVIPDDLQLDHLCRVHNCVNPAHLEPVTVRENVMRGVLPAKVAARNRARAGRG